MSQSLKSLKRNVGEKKFFFQIHKISGPILTRTNVSEKCIELEACAVSIVKELDPTSIHAIPG